MQKLYVCTDRGAKRTFSRAGTMSGYSNKCVQRLLSIPSATLQLWASFLAEPLEGGLLLCLICGDLAVFPEGSQLMKTWLKARIISIHTAEGEFTKVACAFSLCASLYKQESHPIFPPGSHGITEPHLFLGHWQCGFKRKIPELPGMPNCWVPESENILPALSVRKTEQHRLKCQAVFWKADSLENKGCWYPARRAGRNRP